VNVVAVPAQIVFAPFIVTDALQDELAVHVLAPLTTGALAHAYASVTVKE